MSKQSSVDFIINILIEKGYAGVLDEDEIEQAKAMHKEEIAKAFDNGEANDFYNNGWIVDGAKYYDKTFGDGNQD